MSYYDVLGVVSTATGSEIRRAYRKKALENHPDKGGDIDKISELNEAYQVLSDNDKRRHYDEHGKDSSNNVEDAFRGDPFRVFREMFSSMYGDDDTNTTSVPAPGAQRRVQRPHDIFFELPVTCKELFDGCKKKLAVRRQRFCGVCAGKGVEKCDEDITCLQCNGSGMTTMVFKTFLGDQIQTKYCTFCQGSGIKAPISVPRCAGCKGRRLVEERAIIEAVVEPGTPAGWNVPCSGQGNDSLMAGQGRGDVVLQIASSLPAQWLRHGQHLVYQLDIGLGDCVSGVQRVVRHPAGHDFLIDVQQVIRPSLVTATGALLAPWIAADMGMPAFQGQPTGHVVVAFCVTFPTLLVDDTQGLFIRNHEPLQSESFTTPLMRPPTDARELAWLTSVLDQ